MNYHNLKMEEINKIIRELWRNTYKGHGNAVNHSLMIVSQQHPPPYHYTVLFSYIHLYLTSLLQPSPVTVHNMPS